MPSKPIIDEPYSEIEKRLQESREKDRLEKLEKEKQEIAEKKKTVRKPRVKKEEPVIQEDTNGNKFFIIDEEKKEDNVIEEKDNSNLYKGAENEIEFQMKAAQAPRSEIDVIAEAQLQIHEDRKNITEKFLASALQKTEIKKDHRVIIPIIQMLAKNPFPNIACHIADKEEREKIEAEFSIGYLESFMEGFLNLGIPVDRKGRKEEVDVLTAYLRQETSMEANTQQNKGFK